jgi:hypothetical protein
MPVSNFGSLQSRLNASDAFARDRQIIEKSAIVHGDLRRRRQGNTPRVAEPAHLR